MSNNKNLEERGWEDMSALLDKEMPQRRVGLFYWWMAIGMLVLLTAAFMLWRTDLVFSGDTVQKVANVEDLNKEQKARSTNIEFTKPHLKDTEPVSGEVNHSLVQKSPFKHKRSPVNSDIGPTDLYTDKFEMELQYVEPDPLFAKTIAHKDIQNTPLLIETEPQKRNQSIDKLAFLDIRKFYNQTELITSELSKYSPPAKQRYSSDIWPEFLQLQFMSDLHQNTSFDLSVGWEYSISQKLSLQSAIAYTYDYVSAHPMNYKLANEDATVLNGGDTTFNQDFQEEVTGFLNRSYSNQGNSAWIPLRGSDNGYLRYGNLSQHMVSVEQNLLFTLAKVGKKNEFYTKLGGRLSYALVTRSEPNILVTYPEFNNGTVNLGNSGIFTIDDPNDYVPRWYYGLQLGFGIHLDQKWSFEINASTLQTMNSDQDLLDLNKKRDIRLSLGLRRYL